MRRMNQQKKSVVNEGQQAYSNIVPGSDPKYQIRMFNGQPQFRIKKRQDSAKNQINRTEHIRKARDSAKCIETIANDPFNDETNITDGEVREEKEIK